MNEAIKEYNPSGRIKKPSYSLVANWVKDSWDAIDPNMIKRSFKCCGISNDVNGLEDDLIFDLSKLENVNNQRTILLLTGGEIHQGVNFTLLRIKFTRGEIHHFKI